MDTKTLIRLLANRDRDGVCSQSNVRADGPLVTLRAKIALNFCGLLRSRFKILSYLWGKIRGFKRIFYVGSQQHSDPVEAVFFLVVLEQKYCCRARGTALLPPFYRPGGTLANLSHCCSTPASFFSQFFDVCRRFNLWHISIPWGGGLSPSSFYPCTQGRYMVVLNGLELTGAPIFRDIPKPLRRLLPGSIFPKNQIRQRGFWKLNDILPIIISHIYPGKRQLEPRNRNLPAIANRYPWW